MPELANYRQEQFAREYVRGFNGKQAALKAGYSPKGAEVHASRLLSDDKVAKRVAELKAQQWRKLQMGTDELQARMAAIARADPRKLVDKDGQAIPLHLLDDETAWAIAGVDTEERVIRDPDGDEEATIVQRTKKVRFADKGKAMEMLARIANLFEPEAKGAADAMGNAIAQALGSVVVQRNGVAGLAPPKAIPQSN